MAVKLENFHDAIPNRLSLKHFLHWHTLDVCGVRAVQSPDCLP